MDLDLGPVGSLRSCAVHTTLFGPSLKLYGVRQGLVWKSWHQHSGSGSVRVTETPTKLSSGPCDVQEPHGHLAGNSRVASRR